jgi:hypothetical protein
MLINIGALVVVAENDGLLAEFGAGNANAFLAVRVGQAVEWGKCERVFSLHWILFEG